MRTPRLQMVVRLLPGAAFLIFLAGCGTLPPQVMVVGDVTPMGKKVTPPDAEHPVYYLPLVVGYKELGATFGGESKQPKKDDVSHFLAVALANQHYLVMSPRHPPDQLLVFWWGSMNPEIQDFGSNDPTQQVFFNEREMLALVGAYKSGSLAPWDAQDLRTAARDNRYFVIVMAYDFAAARQHQKKLLWMAKMSTPSNRTNLPEVLPAMIASGGPMFGLDTKPLVVDSGQALREGHVVLAPIELKETIPADKK